MTEYSLRTKTVQAFDKVNTQNYNIIQHKINDKE